MALNKVIVVGSNKGGSGKTTSTASIADCLARKQHKSVLVIDADPQGNISSFFGYLPSQNIPNNLASYLTGKYLSSTNPGELQPVTYFISAARKYVPRSDKRNDYENLDIIPSNGGLTNIYNVLNANSNANGLFRELFDEIRALDKYDYILVDTKPTIDNTLLQIMFGADYLLVPSTDGKLSFMGANSIGVVFQQVHERRKAAGDATNIEFLGMFLNMIKLNTKTERAIRGEGILQFWGDNPIFETKVKLNQDVKNAEELLAPVTAAFPSSVAAVAFNALTREVVSKIE